MDRIYIPFLNIQTGWLKYDTVFITRFLQSYQGYQSYDIGVAFVITVFLIINLRKKIIIILKG
jgi:hypothetical protein